MKGVMLMAYGTPNSLDDVEAYYTHIRGGKKPSEEELTNLLNRYKKIGGTSPLLRITNQQVADLQSLIRSRGFSTRVYAAMKHSKPFISDVMEKVNYDGVDNLLCITLAPHYSSVSVGAYIRATEDANAKLSFPLQLKFVRSWHNHPRLISAWVKMIKNFQEKLESYWLIFSAHSLPEKIIRNGDPYKDQLLESSRLIAREMGTERWSFAFQSASSTKERWLGPDIIDHLHTLYNNGKRSFLIAPIGFVSDHLEILYDIDIECKEWAKHNRVPVARCESLNNSKELVECLYSLVEENDFLS